MQKERWMGEENKSWWTRLKGSCRLVPEPAQPLYSCRKRPGLLAFGLGVEHRAGDLHSQIGGSRRMSLGKSLHVPGSLTQAGDGAGINGRKRVVWESCGKAGPWSAVISVVSRLSNAFILVGSVWLNNKLQAGGECALWFPAIRGNNFLLQSFRRHIPGCQTLGSWCLDVYLVLAFFAWWWKGTQGH